MLKIKPPNEETIDLIYQYIVYWKLKLQIAPSFREIADHFGIGIGKVSVALDVLQERKLITRYSWVNRGIVVEGARFEVDGFELDELERRLYAKGRTGDNGARLPNYVDG